MTRMHAVARFTPRGIRQECMQWQDLLQQTCDKNACSGKIYSKTYNKNACSGKIYSKRHTTRIHEVRGSASRDIRQECTQ